MYIRKVRRKCGVKACNHIDCYSISKSSEFGNSIIICKSCLEETLKAVEKFEKPTEIAKKVEVKETITKEKVKETEKTEIKSMKNMKKTGK